MAEGEGLVVHVDRGEPALLKRGGRVLLLEILSARIARSRFVYLISIREKARKARIDNFALDEGFQPHQPPPLTPGARARFEAAPSKNYVCMYMYIYIYN